MLIQSLVGTSGEVLSGPARLGGCRAHGLLMAVLPLRGRWFTKQSALMKQSTQGWQALTACAWDTASGLSAEGTRACVLSHSAVSDSLWPCGLQPARLLCPWDSPGNNTGVGCHALLQGIFPTQGLNPRLPHCWRILYCLSRQESPYYSAMKKNKIESFVETWTVTQSEISQKRKVNIVYSCIYVESRKLV